MTASDSLSGQQFFHGTDKILKPGTVLTGGHPKRYSSAFPDDLANEHNQSVWMHTSPSLASDYGDKVYEVAPHNPEVYGADEADEPEERLHRWITPQATVVRRVPRKTYS